MGGNSMSALATKIDSHLVYPDEAAQGKAVWGKEPNVLTEVYQQDTNMVIWQKSCASSLQPAIDAFLANKKHFKIALSVSPDTAFESIHKALGNADASLELSKNITELVDMFCCLFDLKRAGLRLAILDSAMCPRFHVDRVPCRLVTTYEGVATQWLPHNKINRSALGVKTTQDPLDQSGLYQEESDIEQLQKGDVALLKGELWQGNENKGLVHRSPPVGKGEKRLLLTLDFLD
jgi:hypothetical protein